MRVNKHIDKIMKEHLRLLKDTKHGAWDIFHELERFVGREYS